MNKEDKIDVLKAIAQSVNMDRTQFVLVLESGNTVCYNNHEISRQCHIVHVGILLSLISRKFYPCHPLDSTHVIEVNGGLVIAKRNLNIPK